MKKYYPTIIFWLIMTLIFSWGVIGYLDVKHKNLKESYYIQLEEKIELQNKINMYEWFDSTERRFPV